MLAAGNTPESCPRFGVLQTLDDYTSVKCRIGSEMRARVFGEEPLRTVSIEIDAAFGERGIFHHYSVVSAGMIEPRQLGRDAVRALFQDLSDRLATGELTARLFVVGWATMALAYAVDRLTWDVGALFVPAPGVQQIAEEVSGLLGLEPGWLNDTA